MFGLHLRLTFPTVATSVAGAVYTWIATTYRLTTAGQICNHPALIAGELWSNPGFDSDTAWTKGAGWSITGGKAVRSGAAAQSNLTQTPGAANRYDLYHADYTVSEFSAGAVVALIQGAAPGARKSANGTYATWCRPGQGTAWGFQATVDSVLKIDNVTLQAIDMDTALAMIQTSDAVHRVGAAFATAPVDDAMFVVMCAGAANSLYDAIIALLFQNTDSSYRIRLAKIVGGVPSTVGADATITFVAGAILEIRRVGNVFTIYYNNLATSATGTIDDASIVDNPYYGFCILGAAARVDNFWLNGRRVPFADPIQFVPLVSDGFSVVGTTDGLGHAGVAGGAGLGWLDGGIGDFVTAAGRLTWHDGSGMGDIPYMVDAGTTEVDVTADVTWSSGESGVIVRMSNDGAYFVRAGHDGTNLLLTKIINFFPTTILIEPVAYVSGAAIRLRVRDNKFQAYYDGLPVGAEQTINDATLQTGTYVGVSSNGDGNTFDNFVCYVS